MADMPMFRKLDSSDLEESYFSAFINYEFNYNPTLSMVIKTLGWGNNRIIKQGGFRVLTPITKGLKPIKEWKRVTDPKFLIEESSYISKPKGQSVAVVHLKK